MDDSYRSVAHHPAEGEVRAGEVTLHYLDWGGPTSSPVTLVFLHAGGLSAHSWDLVCDGLRSEYRCIALDQRGHGESDWSPDGGYEIEAVYRQDLQAVVQGLALEKIVLIGSSLGGTVAISHAGSPGADLAGLVLVDVTLRERPDYAQKIRDFMRGPQVFDSLDAFVDHAITLTPGRPRERVLKGAANHLRPVGDALWTWKYDPRYFDAVLEDQKRWDGLAALRRITCPTLLVRGGNSEVLLDDEATDIAATMQRCRWVTIDGATHIVHGDRPREFLQALREFLAQDVAVDGGAPRPGFGNGHPAAT